MCKPGMHKIIFRERENLRLVLQFAEGVRENDAIVVLLESASELIVRMGGGFSRSFI